ncbi:oxygenase MpaB family protein [Streptomyces sp. NPDC055037]
MATTHHNDAGTDFRVVTKAKMMGTAQRWRRFGEPTPAGRSLNDDGEPDNGVLGPGSVAWEVMLHPSQMFFETITQGMLQFTYKPILAGVRDVDPLSRKAREGTATVFDAMDRGQRNSGIHAPMWFGDTPTARRVAKHLHNIHGKVEGGVIDVGEPELGGYKANSPRESMWAALTEVHAMLWVYERLGRGTRRLTDAERDQYIAECAEYVKLFPHIEDEVPTSMAELRALYEKYEPFFRHSPTKGTQPVNGEDWHETVGAAIKKNFHKSQLPLMFQTMLQQMFNTAVAGAGSGIMRRNMGMSPAQSRRTIVVRKAMTPLIRLMQCRPIERYYMRLMWGPDAIALITSARELHAEAKRTGRAAFNSPIHKRGGARVGH